MDSVCSCIDTIAVKCSWSVGIRAVSGNSERFLEVEHVGHWAEIVELHLINGGECAACSWDSRGSHGAIGGGIVGKSHEGSSDGVSVSQEVNGLCWQFWIDGEIVEECDNFGLLSSEIGITLGLLGLDLSVEISDNLGSVLSGESLNISDDLLSGLLGELLSEFDGLDDLVNLVLRLASHKSSK